MAAKDESEDLTCTVCLEEFREPKLLPCCHTFCRGCLKRILEKSRQKNRLSCPQCREEHEVTEWSGPSAFLTDFTVLQAFRIRRLTTKRKSCGMCSGERVRPVSFCEECEEYLCGYCDGAHRRMKVFTDHSVVSLSKFKPESFIPKPKPCYCQQHPQNVVQFFCQTCNQLICGNCVAVSQTPFADGVKHRKHTFITLSDGLKPMETRLEELVDSSDHDRRQCESSLYSLGELEKHQDQHTQQLKMQVNTAVDLYIKRLQDSRVQALAEIDAKSTKKKISVQTYKHRLKTAVSHIKSGSRFAMKALQCHDDTERIVMMGRATSQLKQPTGLYEIQKMLETPPLVVNNLETTLLREFKLEDIKITFSQKEIQIGEKAELEVTISTKPIGEPKFLIKYGSSYKCSLTPQTVILEPDKWLLKFTPSCGGRHIVNACIYGVWVSDKYSVWEHNYPTFYVHGTLKEGNIVRRTPYSKKLLSTAMRKQDTKETAKVTKVSRSTSKAGSLCDVEVEWSSGEKSYKERFQWDDVNGYPLELAL